VPRIPVAGVSSQVLDYLFDEFRIWPKIKDGRLTSTCLKGIASHNWPNATSFIIKHSLPNGKHVVTTHCVKDDSGNVLHWDAKDIRLNDVRLWRAE